MKVSRSWLFALALVGGCQNMALDPVLSKATAVSDDLSVVVELSRASFRTGDSISVRVSATNISSRTLTLHSLGCPVWFEVLRDSVVVGPGNFPCALIAVSKELKSGESHAIQYAWSGTTTSGPGSPFVPLPPGDYTIRGQIRQADRLVRGAAKEVRILP